MRAFFRWLLQPSGGPTWERPAWLVWLDRQKRRPILAHPGGLAFAAAGLLGLWLLTHSIGIVLFVAVMGMEGTNQYHKATRGVYGTRLWFNVLVRLGLGAAGALIVLGWFI